MNIIQKIRATHLNRHGFIDALVGIVVFQVVYITLLFKLSTTDIDVSGLTPPSIGFILLTSLVVAPLVENLALVCLAAIHEKLFNRTGLFVVAPMLLTAFHFYSPRPMHFPILLRVLSLFFFFYVYLKQYDLHKLETGKFKALLLSSVIHFATNASAILIAFFLEPDIAAETIFSAQPGE